METTELLGLSALGLGAAIKSGKTTAVEAMEAVLGQIERQDKEYNCYVTVDREGALKKAAEVQKKIEAGELTGPLAGVPAALKDNLCTGGLRTTCASRMLDNFVPAFSAEAVLNLERAGAVVIGKTNMDEFAMGSTTETSYYGPTKNPENPAHVPGGSSGGSAAAVAARECFFALGSDTGGSIRQPASYCGVVGMKPTYGTVSRYGLIAYGSSLDQIGPLTGNVEDCAAVLELIASYDPKDSTSIRRTDTDFTKALVEDVKGMRIGIPKDYFREGLDPEVGAAVLKAAEALEKKGALTEEFDLSLVEYAIPAYYTIASAEASSNLERFDGVKYGFRAGAEEGLHKMYRKTRSQGFGPEVKRRIMLGTFVLSAGYYDAYYLKALRVKAMIKEAFDRAFAKYDCILGPVAPTTAPRLDASLSDPLKMYLGDIYTISVNLAGLPGISLPCGRDSSGLPIGLQLIGDCYQEKKLLRIAYTYQQCGGICHETI
ncbi:MAG: Asp-tRNA(Asn)/Glu-tRNA(Gln) amidotransferase subunit GatA [Butyrivibrio sp.]|nr:Asp-tRNA(Asn)/Glu-tRNA(Gln) amidotransferase subunit GatA [Acetatifactor muris]MCM1559709.1 Asp-tRNA(Asn)/Glu-tRNA(Gln) amidotransferase subunit GatA [Butyrivibrio sp.]